MKAHPLAALFPPISGEEYVRFRESIREQGLLEDITTHEGMVLDGLNRLRACTDLGIAPRFTAYKGSDPAAFVVAMNLSRRHLDEVQATVALPAPEVKQVGIPDFEEFQKIARLSRDVVVTEKIDGTNACVFIPDGAEPIVLGSGRVVPFMCGSRTRWIFPENDNAGFARWAYDHADELLKLGPGRHFGEWWGAGIQRRYGLGQSGEKRFSLFNTHRWSDAAVRPACCHVVPVLYRGAFDTARVEATLTLLGATGSVAAPGFMDPEGVVIWHEAARQLFKKTLLKDSEWKGRSVAGDPGSSRAHNPAKAGATPAPATTSATPPTPDAPQPDPDDARERSILRGEQARQDGPLGQADGGGE